MRMWQLMRGYIQDNGFLLKKIAERSGIEQKRFYRIINGKVDMTIDDYEAICAGLNVEPSFFHKKKFSKTEKSA